MSFSISDKVLLRVNVGSGNALLTTTDMTIPETGSSLVLGTSYNSLLVGSGVPVGSNGYGWRQREGIDVQLYPASDGSVTYLGEDGTAGKFTPSGSGYASPAQFHVILVKSSGGTCGGTGYTMTWHATGRRMCFTTAGLLTSEADRNGNTTAFSYNSSGQETKVTYTPHGASSPTRTVSVSYTGSYLTGLSESGGSAGTRTVSYAVNSSTGNLSTLTQPDNTQITFGYDSSHDLTSITNGDNAQTTLAYNSSHQVTSATQATTGTTTATTRFAYPSSTQTLEADPNTDQSQAVSSVPHVTYTVGSTDALITKVVDQQGNTRSTSYTSFDDVKTYTNGVGGPTTNTYGANGGESLTNAQSPTGAAVSSAYGNSATSTNPTANFQPGSSKDAQGNSTAYTYDGAGNLLQSANALPATAKVTYNSDGTPATSTDPMNGSNSTSYSYTDGNHELNKITPPTGNSLQPRTITYDGFGRVATMTDGAGNTATYTYDLADRITQVAYTGGQYPVTVTYSYDGAGNLQSRTDPSGTTTWTYDGRNLVTSRATTSGGGTLSYGYDLDGNLTSVTDPNPQNMGHSATTSYSYDSRNLLDEMTDPVGHQWRFSYDADGRRTTTWFNTNSTESTWAAKLVTSYDKSGRITRIQATANSAAPQVPFDTSYCYSPYVSGQSCPTGSASTDTSLVQYTTNNTTGAVSVDSYDKGNRLTKQTNNAWSGYAATYSYDADGSLTSLNETGQASTWSYNSANEISSSGYSYDGAGNLTNDPADPAAGAMTYNDAGQMIQDVIPGSPPSTEKFSYADRTQAEVLSDGTASNITYGLAGQSGQPWVQDYNNTGNIGAGSYYVMHDQQGTPLGQISSNGAATDVAFVTDNLGSVVATIGSDGSIVENTSYSPYGSDTDVYDANRLTYTSALSDSQGGAGFMHLGNRWYDPSIGRFTQQDSMAQLATPANGNLYAYAADSPINYIDPTGGSCGSNLLGYAATGSILTGTAEGAVAVAEGALFTTAAVAVGSILGGVFGVGLVLVAVFSC